MCCRAGARVPPPASCCGPAELCASSLKTAQPRQKMGDRKRDVVLRSNAPRAVPAPRPCLGYRKEMGNASIRGDDPAWGSPRLSNLVQKRRAALCGAPGSALWSSPGRRSGAQRAEVILTALGEALGGGEGSRVKCSSRNQSGGLQEGEGLWFVLKATDGGQEPITQVSCFHQRTSGDLHLLSLLAKTAFQPFLCCEIR